MCCDVLLRQQVEAQSKALVAQAQGSARMKCEVDQSRTGDRKGEHSR